MLDQVSLQFCTRCGSNVVPALNLVFYKFDLTTTVARRLNQLTSARSRVYGADKLSHTKSYPTLTWRWIQTSNYTCTVVLNVGLNWSTESGTTIAQRMSLVLVHDPTIHFFIRFIYPVDMFSHSFVRSFVHSFLGSFVCSFVPSIMYLCFCSLLVESLSAWWSLRRGSYLWPLNLSFITQQLPAAL